jgi:ligand-binding sensor domain-containing protein
MKKCVKLFALFSMAVFFSCCKQKQTYASPDIIRSETKDIVTSYLLNAAARNIKKGRNGAILIAASFAGVFRYDGKSFTNLTSKVGSHRFWDVLEDRRGNIWFASTDSGVYYYNGKTFQHFTTGEGLANNWVVSICEDSAGIIWFPFKRS